MANAAINHFFRVTQYRRSAMVWFENPDIYDVNLVQKICQCVHSLGTFVPSGWMAHFQMGTRFFNSKMNQSMASMASFRCLDQIDTWRLVSPISTFPIRCLQNKSLMEKFSWVKISKNLAPFSFGVNPEIAPIAWKAHHFTNIYNYDVAELRGDFRFYKKMERF